MRFLFALPDMAGNAPPILEVARRLSQRGHSVRALADASLQPAIEARGCQGKHAAAPLGPRIRQPDLPIQRAGGAATRRR